MSTHDLIVTYGNTEKHDFPLVLIIGREPSNALPFSPTTGPYDFDDAPRCAFWNTSYAVVGASRGLDVRGMKRMCRRAGSSPIAFTDASPIPIENRDRRKREIRSSITEADIENHVDAISRMEPILSRTRLVLLSGHRSGALGKTERRNFGVASTLLEALFDARSIPHLSVPFMYGTNQPKIRAIISGDASASRGVASTVRAFEQACRVDGTGRAA